MLLDIRNLHLEFQTFDGTSKILVGVNLQLQRGDILALVGETGCGKSMTALSIPRLISMPPGKITQGQVLFEGEDLLQKPRSEMRKFRAKHLGMIFQDPTTNLNPLFTIREQLVDAVLYQCHAADKVSGRWKNFLPSARQLRQDAHARAVELMQLVGIPDGKRRLEDYPHQFSGGMRQRVLIAMALAGSPDLLIADEPTTALDVTIQAQILDLIKTLRRELGMAIVWVTHDLGVVANLADRVMVMYSGFVVERADVKKLYGAPKHPYTRALLRTLPDMEGERAQRLESIEGQPPDLLHMPDSCPFAPRCAYVFDRCTTKNPLLEFASEDHEVACWWDMEKNAPREI